jgi:hypothetical protein
MSNANSSPSDETVAFWADFEGSDDEAAPAEITFKSACATQITFGTKFKGETLGALVRTKSGRSYLRYLLAWDELFEDFRANIEFLMASYAANSVGVPSKKRKR